MKIFQLVIGLLLVSLICAQADIYKQYYQEARKIAQAMTLDEKIGQMIQADFKAVTDELQQKTNPDEAVKLALGSLLISGMAIPTSSGDMARIPIPGQYDKHIQAFTQCTAANWKKLTDRFKDLGVTVTVKNEGKYKIKFLLGSDAVHGDQHTLGNVLFPHNIGLSCTRNQGNFQNIGYWTKEGLKRVGFNYAFAPTVAVSHNPQWGRFYQSMGQDPDMIAKYAQSYVRGLQAVSNGKITGVLGSVKHFFGDGATLYGANSGNANVFNLTSFTNNNIGGYLGAVKSNIGSVMVSYSGINSIPNSINSQFLMNLLREDIKFNGFTISDYMDVTLLEDITIPRTFLNISYEDGHAVSNMVNGGVDMFMISDKKNVQRVFREAKRLISRKRLQQNRLEEAVTRILTVKLAMGLVSKSNNQQEGQQEEIEKIQSMPPLTSSQNQYIDSLNAVHQSLVLLKNDNTLPARNLLSTIKYVILIGEKIHNLNGLTKIQLFRNFDNIGMQCGGWSVRWQGVEGNPYWTGASKTQSNASSILDALKTLQKTNAFEILYPDYSNTGSQSTITKQRSQFIQLLKTKRSGMNFRNTLIIGTFGEFPYAETDGDVNIPYCKGGSGAPGCLYRPSSNQYAPFAQTKTLKAQVSKFEKEVISTLRQADKNIPMASVILSGRPVLLDDIRQVSNSILAAWLPGTSGGQGIINAISGAYTIRPSGSKGNSLSMNWPKTMESLKDFPIYTLDGFIPKINDADYQVGFGLSTQRNEQFVKE